MQTHPVIHSDFPPGVRIIHAAALRWPCAFAMALLIPVIGTAIKVNQWVPKKLQEPVNQPDSRSYTIGTYRGNNATYLYSIPASAFVVGTNTLAIDVLSGFKDADRWLSAGWVFDAVQLDAEPATGKAH